MKNIRLNFRHGFTLIEVMIVIVLFGLMLGTGLPAAREFNRRQVANSIYDEMIADLRSIESTTAANGGRACPGTFSSGRVTFNIASGRITSYTLSVVCSGGSTNLKTKTVPSEIRMTINRGGGSFSYNYLPLERGTDIPNGNPLVVSIGPASSGSVYFAVTISSTGEISV